MARLVGYFLLLSLAIVTLVGLIAYMRAREALQQSVFDRLVAVAALKEDELNRWIDDQRRDVVFIAWLPEVREQAGLLLSGPTSDPEYQAAYALLTEYLKFVVTSTSDSAELFILDLDGNIVLSTDKAHEVLSQAEAAYFVEGRSRLTQHVYTSPVTGEPTITIATPLFDESKRRVGVLASHLNLARIDRLILERTGLGTSGETYLVNTSNSFVSAEALLSGQEPPGGAHSEGIDAALRGADGSGLYLNYADSPVIGVYRWVDDREVALLAEMSQAEAFAPARRLAWTILLIGSISVGLLAVAVYLLARQIARPVLAITDTATQVAAGDLSQTAPVITEDEVGVLARAFNQMTGQLRVLYEHLEEQVVERTAALSRANEQLQQEIVERARVEEDLRRQNEYLEALHATMAEISAELELSRVLKAVLQRAVMLLNATGGDLGLYDQTEKRLTIVSSYNMGKDYTGTIMIPGEGAMGQVILTGKPVHISNYQKWDGRSPQYTSGPWHGVFASPLMITDQLVGVIGIVSDDPNRQFSKTDSNLLNLFAQQAAIAVKNARLFEQTQSALAETEVLYQAARSMIAYESLPDLLQSVVDNLAVAIPADRVLLVTLDLKNEILTHSKSGGVGAHKLHPNSFQELWEGLTGWVIRERKPALSPKNELDSREKPNIQKIRQETDGGSVIVVPLMYRNDILGTLTAVNRLDQPNFTQRDVELMVTVGNQTAIAIANAQLFEAVQKLAITDDLAGTYNRRHLFELGNIEFRRARRFDRALSIIMLDLDHFKVINDTHGHAVGDRVLNAVAQRCQNHIRDIDILGRYGGEEFIILLPETSAKAAYSLADRLRKRVAEKAVSTKVGPIYITISLGVAMLCDDDPDLETLFDHADSALYAAKEAGRNCVMYYNPKE